ncbi:hypothetical protein TSOC_003164 [Tetrabaena socialis]|uniref:Uncharacterized protein n=1 Tax=Tetrabaena socialis TaxID=47790 RepID=A0A2J8ACA9_9CHLO|nr:hypothetical protein TSOC_003164 [Tetrabaena socialis]|eukprot:PNH10150.1 hypothetical protein TSOC_003164 [Tetrabaena socialis]
MARLGSVLAVAVLALSSLPLGAGEVSLQTAHHGAEPNADEFQFEAAPQLTYRLVDRENDTSTVNTKVDFGDDVDLITGDVVETSLNLEIPKDVADQLGLGETGSGGQWRWRCDGGWQALAVW